MHPQAVAMALPQTHKDMVERDGVDGSEGKGTVEKHFSTSPTSLLVRLAVLNYFSPAHTSQVEKSALYWLL